MTSRSAPSFHMETTEVKREVLSKSLLRCDLEAIKMCRPIPVHNHMYRAQKGFEKRVPTLYIFFFLIFGGLEMGLDVHRSFSGRLEGF